MADQAELAFVKNFAHILASAPVQYPDDFQQPLQNWLKKVPTLPVSAFPDNMCVGWASDKPRHAASITVTFKSIKPPKSYTLSVAPTDPIASIKAQLAAQPGAPPADAQRLLLKGKALADSKLLREYAVSDGDTVNLLLKPGFAWDPSATPPKPANETETEMNVNTKRAGAHSRVPSVVLSPSPSGSFPDEKPVDILLTLDTSTIPTPSLSPEASSSTYHDTIVKPEFWEHLLTFLRSEFQNYEDATQAWEDFLRVSKGTLTPGQIAKIRDHVGVVGMAGT
ncbi:ubiquitin-domain-containing protein [Gloeophyllum trabeum ATCC 11539]|uniref:Ubiquitin-domain-containing protein n=1 Tax=Gloeophyllum trabeum (strain ATCC 11539 / FP-39264 / Madison 617) TaxID=670483 RepID=S7RCM9_GLOTA|nr:ubiquitin-domain-containing protein [Gloeophyllum trabeum ATCC 11539]EPQ50149.1 ubiquitin-domain-containing protein [Gloeophyllum trabeum ATCC 11539]